MEKPRGNCIKAEIRHRMPVIIVNIQHVLEILDNAMRQENK